MKQLEIWIAKLIAIKAGKFEDVEQSIDDLRIEMEKVNESFKTFCGSEDAEFAKAWKELGYDVRVEKNFPPRKWWIIF